MKEQWHKYKERWDNLGKREQLALTMGAAVVALFILYELIWTPYLNAVNSLRQRISASQETLNWMQATDKNLQQLSRKETGTKLTPVVLLGIVQKEVNSSGLAGELILLKQSNVDAIQLNFQKVVFDKLMAMLIKLTQEQNVYISQFSVTADPTPGLVTAEITLRIAA